MIQVSIIIPIYNVEPYIEKCLQSVADQTYQGSMECLLIDDCGQDQSMAITEQFVLEYNKRQSSNNIIFRILHHDRNRGLSAARNTGINNAIGKWIYFIDSDDWIIPECLELLMQSAAKYPHTQAVYAGIIDDSGYYQWADYTNKDYPNYTDNREWISVSLLQRLYLGMTAWNKMLRASIIKENNIGFVEGLVYEDEVWNLQLSQIIQQMSFVKINTYYYNQRPTSIVNTISDEKQITLRIKMWNVMAVKIKGFGRKNQVKSLVRWIIDSTQYHYTQHRKDIALLFIKLAIKVRSWLSIFLLFQALLTLITHSKYNNRIIRHFSQYY